MGLRVVTYFGYTVTSLLSLVAFFTHFYSSGLQRTTMYGVLRSMGMAPRQLYASLVIEQLILVIWGIVTGTLLGLAVNELVLPGLPLSLGGSIPVPPFIPQTDWTTLAKTYAVLTGSYLATLILSTFLLWRIKLHRILRVGQE